MTHQTLGVDHIRSGWPDLAPALGRNCRTGISATLSHIVANRHRESDAGGS